MRGIDKTFPGVHALRAVDLDVRVGEILGLVGENGAGKSTLVKILAGAYGRDAGEILIAGEAVEASSPNEMIGRGIAVIYQEPSLAPHLSVAENIFMGRLPTRRFGIVDRRKLVEDTAVVAERLGLDIDPRSASRDAERRPAPDGRDRQGAVARRAPDRARRAVRCPCGCRAGRTRAGHAPPRREGRGVHLHLAPTQ